MSAPRTVHEALRLAAAARPDTLAYRVGAASVSFAQLEAQVARCASGLSRYVGPGDRVAIATGTRLETLVLVHASHWIGAVPAVLDARLDEPRVARRVASAECRLLVTAHPRPERTGQAVAVALAELEAGVPTAARAPTPLSPEQPAFLQFTSGTTGEPRAAVISHAAAMAYLVARAAKMEISPEDVLITWVPLHHDLGLVMFGLGAVAFQVPVHLLQPELRRLREWLTEIGRLGATVTASPDFGFRIAARLVDPAGIDLSSLRYALDGGEPPRLSTIRAFEERFGVPNVIRPGYGLAEATLGVTTYAPDQELRMDEGGRVSSGQPVDGMRVRIVGDRGRELSAGDTGEIHVSGPQLFGGYYGDEQATREVLLDGWLRTGDVGYLDADGYLFVLARERAMIKRAGATIAPVELEETIDQLPQVRRSAAFGMGDGDHELIVVAEVAAEQRDGDLERAIVERVVAVAGAPPDEVRIVSPRSIPLSRSGKTRYGELRKQWGEGTLATG